MLTVLLVVIIVWLIVLTVWMVRARPVVHYYRDGKHLIDHDALDQRLRKLEGVPQYDDVRAEKVPCLHLRRRSVATITEKGVRTSYYCFDCGAATPACKHWRLGRRREDRDRVPYADCMDCDVTVMLCDSPERKV